MKIIDAHIHFSKIESFKDTALEKSYIDYSGDGLKKEYDQCGVIIGIGMGVTESGEEIFPDKTSENPMRLDLEEKLPEFVFECVGVNPIKLLGENRDNELLKIEESLKEECVVGIKIYAGYYHYHVWDDIYNPIYEMAEKYQLPVVIHCGDTYSENGLLKYSHPLHVDELALKYRGVNFVIAHIGDPWVMDAAEVMAKNRNVYGDISGLIVGDEKQVERFMNEELFMTHIKRSLVYLDNYEKILFGTDWPLVKVKPYIEFVKALVPEEYHEDVFYNNALNVFKRIRRDNV